MFLIIKHIDIEGPGTFAVFLEEKSISFSIVDFSKNMKLPHINECQAIVLLGGPMNVYEIEKYPFLREEECLLEDALRRNMPILGICLGAQLLARVCGASIVKAKKSEIGWYPVNITEQGKKDDLFRGFEDVLHVFQWHEDTFNIPEGGVLLSTSENCQNQAFRFGECAWGLQFHPEMTKAMLGEWLDYYPNRLDKNKILYSYFEFRDKYFAQSKLFYENFLKVVMRAKVAGE